MLELYYRPMACSLASRICLIEAGLEAKFTAVDLAAKTIVATGTDYCAVTAMGQVPVLVLEDGSLLTENTAVLQYIADRAPKKRLAPPPQADERYRLQQWLGFVATELHKAAVYPTFSADSNDGAKSFARARAVKALKIPAARLSTAPYLMGDSFGIADAYLFWSLLLLRYSNLELEQPLEEFVQRVMARPAAAEAIALERSEMN